jgi:serine/threonine protein kinase
MSLSPGLRLGPYEILAPIGAGGMGEVDRAHDAKLHRDVAIKVLPKLFAEDPDRVMRFEREAQTLAALNHPNIAQVFGVIEAPPALVMELVEGRGLDDMIGALAARRSAGDREADSRGPRSGARARDHPP